MSDVICDIIAGRLEAEVVWHDDLVIAFLDHRPVFKGHVLLAPVTHVPTFTDAPADLVAPLFLQVQRVADSVVTGLRGFFWPRTKYADGEAARYAEMLRTALAGA